MTERPFTPEEIRSFLRECVTVVKPGELLAVRLGETWTPNQAGELQMWADVMHETNGWPKVLFVLGDGLGVIEANPWIPATPDGLPPETYPAWRKREQQRREAGDG